MSKRAYENIKVKAWRSQQILLDVFKSPEL